ncbi:MAG: hypothetical protein KJ905_00590 [Nanoarchaeota archaeon]|nr:hypothetical protein [Nanoarchaeota archaeon]MBU1501258.1 hypothetical protein [Nanoarchaeota archaeon]
MGGGTDSVKYSGVAIELPADSFSSVSLVQDLFRFRDGSPIFNYRARNLRSFQILRDFPEIHVFSFQDKDADEFYRKKLEQVFREDAFKWSKRSPYYLGISDDSKVYGEPSLYGTLEDVEHRLDRRRYFRHFLEARRDRLKESVRSYRSSLENIKNSRVVFSETNREAIDLVQSVAKHQGDFFKADVKAIEVRLSGIWGIPSPLEFWDREQP